MTHKRSSSYTYGASSTSRNGAAHHSSSAFSPEAQPHEDWTKVTDLAERRRIQNRIAQRNYRKKLKKRLEDLERKAGSSSSSPEPQSESPSSTKHSRQSSRKSPSPTASRKRQPTKHEPSIQPLSEAVDEDWPMFSDQHPSSISPDPINFPSVEAFQHARSPRLPAADLSHLSAPAADPSYYFQTYCSPNDRSYPWPDKTQSIKQESFVDNDMSPLDMSFYMPASASSMSFDTSFADALTPELCDLYEDSSAGSPADFTQFPQTPLMMMSLSPTSHCYDGGFGF